MKNLVIPGWMVAVVVFVVMFGGIFLTIGTGHWVTTREAEPVRLESGEYNPADIRGSYSVAEIEEFFGVPADAFFAAFLIPADAQSPGFQIKNMEGMFAPVEIDGAEIEVGTDLVRHFTALYSGLPYDEPESEYMPRSAVQVLVEAGKLDDAQRAYREAHLFDLALLAEGGVVEEHAEETDETEDAIEIKGRTTMGELVEYGVTKEQFKELTGVDMPASATGLRDFVTQHDLDMEIVKAGLEVLLGLAEEEPTEPEGEPQEPTAEPEPETPAEAGEVPQATTLEVKGSTSIASVLEAGLSPEQFTEITGLAVPEGTTVSLKDFVDANGLDMETVRTQIIDALGQ